jgi:hypothetical protein
LLAESLVNLNVITATIINFGNVGSCAISPITDSVIDCVRFFAERAVLVEDLCQQK